MRAVFALVLLFLVLGCVSGTETTTAISETGYTDLSAAEAKQLIDTQDVIIIDVSPFFDNGHIHGAVNYYIGSGALDEAMPTLDKSATYLIYCHADISAKAAAQQFVDYGFGNVYRLEGNYAAWVDAGFDVES